jgi:hypothetical protein
MDTIHQEVITGNKVGNMTQQIKTYFPTHQGEFMWNETGRGVQTTTHFSNSDNTHCQM